MAHHFRHVEGCPGWFAWLALRGYIGVDLFFVLSGWLVGGQLLREAKATGAVPLGRFWGRRLFRTLPAYYVTLAGMVAIGHVELAALPSMLLFVQNYTAPLTWLVTWSLCIEEHFYLLLPLATLVVHRLPRWAILAVVVTGVLLSPFLRWASHPEMASRSYGWFLGEFYSPTHLRLDGLVLGVALAAIAEHEPRIWGWLLARRRLLLGLGLAVVTGTTWNPWLTGWTADGAERMAFFASVLGFSTVSIGTVLLLPAASRRFGRVALGWAPFVWLAEHAFTLYLSHEVAAAAARAVLTPLVGASFWPLLAASFAASLVAAALLRRLVEIPGLRARDAWFGAPLRSAASPAR